MQTLPHPKDASEVFPIANEGEYYWHREYPEYKFKMHHNSPPILIWEERRDDHDSLLSSIVISGSHSTKELAGEWHLALWGQNVGGTFEFVSPLTCDMMKGVVEEYKAMRDELEGRFIKACLERRADRSIDE